MIDHRDNLPSRANGWNWGGPSPETYRYRQVSRYYSGDTIWCYQTDDAFSASSAAHIFVANDVPGGYPDQDDPDVFILTGYDMEDALIWFDEACCAGVVFG